MTITCPNCNHSANTERAINPGTRIKCRKCQHLWAYQSPSGWENLKRQVNIGAKAFGRELGMCRGKFHKTDSGPSDLAPPPIIMFALSKLVFKFLFLGVLTVIALAVLAAIVSPTTTTSEKSPAQHATENKAAPVVEVPAITWEQYLADCGLKAQEVNEARSAQLFAEKYRGRLIRWSGTIVSTSEGFWGRYSLLVLMSPTESAFGTSDLSLEAPLGMKNTILSLNKGDRIVFDGKITSQGGHFINHKIELTNLSHTQRPQETRDTTTHLTQQTKPNKHTIPAVVVVAPPTANSIYSLSGEEALVQAREFMVGTWTYAKADFPLWVKWVVREDGTMDAYESHPIDDNWGSPKTCHWEILSDKYGDTGQRYYAFHVKGDNWLAEGRAIISDGDQIQWHPQMNGRLVLAMERGDKFPFSK